MAGFTDLFGKDGALYQLVLWNVVGQAITAMAQPAFTALTQDVAAKHPNFVLTPDLLARAVVGTFIDKAAATADAAKSGIDSARFDIMLELAQVRIQPADLAEAVLRSYMAKGAAETEAAQQGIDPKRFKILTLLAGDGIGPQQAAEARRRNIIAADGMGPDSTSYAQAIAESRLHNKWGPVLFDLTRALLSPPDAASAVVRGFIDNATGIAVAALSGVDEKQFAIMVQLAGDAPSPTELSVALRRGVIPYDSGSADIPGFLQGIRQGRLADKWAGMIQALAQEWPTPTDALEARLVGQIPTDESKALYERFGGDPTYFQLLLDTRGEAPTPLELGVLANRGAIKWDGLGPDKTSFSQGFHEGRWRDKWEDAYRKLAEYRPPESTIILFLTHGVINSEQAADLLSALGMTQEQIAWFIDEAHLGAYSEYRGATVSDILDAYHEQILNAEQAAQILTDLHVDPKAAQIMLELKDVQRAFAAIGNAVARVRSLFAARKIRLDTAQNALTSLGIDPASIASIIKSWQIENSISVKLLTETQIVDAWELQIMSDDDALTELTNIGYTPYDAWVLLSIKAKQPLPNKPDQGPAPPQSQVIPGTT